MWHKNTSKGFFNPRQNHQYLLLWATTTTNPLHQIPKGNSAPVYIPNASTTAYSPSPQPNDGITFANAELVQVQLTAIAKLVEIQNQNRLAPTGNPLQYLTWIKAFETLIKGISINPAKRLHFSCTCKYVSGEAKQVVNAFILLDGEDACLKAKEQLAKRVRDRFVVGTYIIFKKTGRMQTYSA
jgi:hypothetical protein